jgi:hypothetical protein
MADQRIPTFRADGDEWVITVPRTAPARVKDLALAKQIWELAMWGYHNGRDDALIKVREAIGVSS